MLGRLTRWSLDRPRLIAWACAWLILCAALYAHDIKIAFLPDIAPVQMTVQTEAPGLVAEQVEQIVTRPVESALGGAFGVAHVHSQSVEGLSVVTLTLAQGADPIRVREAVTANLSSIAGALPAGFPAPQLSPLSAAGGDVLKLGFTSDKLDPMGLRDVAQWTVRPRLLAVSGVSRVSVYGGQTRSLIVKARPGDLSDSDLGFLDILNAVKRATGVTGAGFIDTPSQRVLIDPRGQALTPDDIGAGQIIQAGSDPTRIADVADVFEAPAPGVGDALIDGKPGVMLAIAAQYDANVLDVTNGVEKAMAVLQPALAAQGVKVDAAIDRPSGFAAATVRKMAFDLLIGIQLAALLLFIFMRDVRAALISLVGIPLSLLLAVMAIKAIGWSANVMTLGGLAVALGVVVDDAVIDVENILSHLRDAERRHAAYPDAILAACLEMRGPVIYSTLAVIMVVSPLLFLPGAQGALLAPLAGAIIAACAASLAVATLVTPALAILFLHHVEPERRPSRIGAAMERWLVRAGQARLLVILASIALVGGAIGVLMFARPQLLPSIHDGALVADITAPPSTSLDVMRDYGTRITKDLQSLPGVASVALRIGRDPTAEGAAGLESAAFDIGLQPDLSAAAQERVAADVGQRLAQYPGLEPMVRTRFDAGAGLAPASAPFAIEVFGSDFDAVDHAAQQVAAALQTLPSGKTARVEDSERAPTVRVDLNFNSLAIYGLSVADVLDTVQAAFATQRVAEVYQADRAEDVSIAAQDSLRQDPEGVGDLLLRSSSGFSVPLRSVANIYLTDARASIAHDDGLRRAVVAANPPPGEIGRFDAAARAAVARSVKLPDGVFLDYQRADQADAAAARSLAFDYALATFAIIALLAIAFDGRSAALILVSSLFSLVGAAIAVLALGEVMSIGIMVGFVALFGVSMRNAILLISRIEDLVLTRHQSWSFATVIRAARERAAPVLMSSVLVALGLAPFAIEAGVGGLEIIGPMAIVIIAGLITGALTTLLLLPVLIFGFWRPGYARLARGHRASPTSPA